MAPAIEGIYFCKVSIMSPFLFMNSFYLESIFYWHERHNSGAKNQWSHILHHAKLPAYLEVRFPKVLHCLQLSYYRAAALKRFSC